MFFSELRAGIRQQDSTVPSAFIIGTALISMAHMYAAVDVTSRYHTPALWETIVCVLISLFLRQVMGYSILRFKADKARSYYEYSNKPPGRYAEFSAKATYAYTKWAAYILSILYACMGGLAMFYVLINSGHIYGTIPYEAAYVLGTVNLMFTVVAAMTFIGSLVHCVHIVVWRYTHKHIWKLFKM